MKGCHLIIEQVFGFDGVVERVVWFEGLEFVVFEQCMVGTFRKEQGRERERVDDSVGRNACTCYSWRKVFQVVVENIVATDKADAFEKVDQGVNRCGVEDTAIGFYRTQVQDGVVPGVYF